MLPRIGQHMATNCLLVTFSKDFYHRKEIAGLEILLDKINQVKNLCKLQRAIRSSNLNSPGSFALSNMMSSEDRVLCSQAGNYIIRFGCLSSLLSKLLKDAQEK